MGVGSVWSLRVIAWLSLSAQITATRFCLFTPARASLLFSLNRPFIITETRTTKMAPAVVDKTTISESHDLVSEATQRYLAKPAGDCCMKGSIHEGEPRGSYTTIAGVETYIVTPPAGRANNHILLYFPDVWGLFNNGLLVMDGFADAGYLTLGLDYFRGVSRRTTLDNDMTYIKSIRILYGNTEKVGTIKLMLTLTMRIGNVSTWPLQMKLYRGGSRRQKRSMAKQKRSTHVLGEFTIHFSL